MDADERARYEKWLAEKWKPPPVNKCVVCAANTWELANDWANVPPRGGPSSAGPFPFLLIICKNCGNTLFINTLVAGIQKP